MSTKPRSLWTPANTLQAAALTTLLAVLFWHVLHRLVLKWLSSEDWSHGFIIPLFSLYYLYIRRDMMPVGLRDRSVLPRLAGAAFLTLAFLLYLKATIARIDYPKNVALVMSIVGTLLMVCGWPLTRWSWFAVAFLMFAMPLPDNVYGQITSPLQRIAARVSAGVLSMVPDMMTEATGTIVEYSYQNRTGTLDVERACSGMRLLMTMTALGVAMTFVNERALWQRLIMILVCVPIAVFCNIIRVTTTGFFVVFGRQDLAQGTAHTLLGLMMLAVAFSLYGATSYVLNHLFVDHQPEPEDGTATGGIAG
ncbi:MAG TPA: exosortase/archaeosortase family protein [Phycisphaerae bacterium]|nr:exosortase/archaeosortase family protein [Phycisphaerae bacterium]HRR86853.1 exosortase/archaeosortase family protein [Phycisphaerae bacterium]